jgi:hypothetical protein
MLVVPTAFHTSYMDTAEKTLIEELSSFYKGSGKGNIPTSAGSIPFVSTVTGIFFFFIV